jgi:ectoine hydroxylase-related dioxygenase (phytanoyl-CoA dioxygenase family)
VSQTLPTDLSDLKSDGFAIIEDCLTAKQCIEWCNRISLAINRPESHGRLQAKVADQSITYGSRNLIELCPEIAELLRIPAISKASRQFLGDCFGLVRGLYFDKPPGVSWSLPWHQDLTIAVASHVVGAETLDGFTKPTVKAGVCHVEAPTWLLEQMLTVRIHLDAMTSENGPLVVRKGSHLLGKLIEGITPPSNKVFEVHCSAGAAMLMRPLLCHSSIPSIADTTMHRRTVHLELCSSEHLPHGFRWKDFIRIDC